MDNEKRTFSDQEIRDIIRDELAFFFKNEKYTVNRPMEFGRAGKIKVMHPDGIEIGSIVTSDTELGFYGKTPTVQLDGVSDPSGGGSAGVDQPARDAIITIIGRLETLGLIKTV